MNHQGYHGFSVYRQAFRKGVNVAEPDIAGRAPIAVDVEAGKTYFWCSCGRSVNQPFCSGAHRGSEFEPIAYLAERTGKVYFCSCKRSGNKPLCDGTHKTLPPPTI
jgi:CDGSH-type Zn-finger protein